jgi:formate dehydrogenase alpha subunit
MTKPETWVIARPGFFRGEKMSVSLTINGIAIDAEPGMTVLEAARANNIYIPTLCYAAKLSAVGACRMCVVQIENMRGFPTACTVPVSDGMVVQTETEGIQNLRREILSLTLSEHPYTCLVCKTDCGIFHGGTIRKAAVTTGCQYCPANGQCELQELVDYLDLKEMPYPIAYRGLPVEQEDPFFDRDYNLCILCGRCVRTCQEVRHQGVLAFVNRGSQAIVGTAFGRSHLETDCQFCGACVDSCPTGALADKRGKWEGPPSEIVPSVCPYCSVGCAVNLQVKNGKVIRAVGREDGSTNDGQLCVRGRFGVVDVVHSLRRLKVPLVRREDRLVEVSWDEALNVIAQRLSQYHGDEFAVVASATATNETNYALQKFARTAMHSNNVALAAGFPTTNYGDALAETLMSIDGPSIRDVRDAACIVAIGTNTFESHPILGLEMRHALRNGAHLIAIDTRQTRMAHDADVWLQPKVGTDHVLLAGIIKTLIEQGQFGPELPPEVQTSLAGLDTDTITATTGVDQAVVVAAVRLLVKCLVSSAEGQGRQRKDVILIYGSGVTDHPTAGQVIRAIHSLASLADSIGIIGVPGEGNLVGGYDMGMHPSLLPGYRPASDPAAQAVFGEAWDASVHLDSGRSYETIVQGIREGQVKALYLAGEMPALPQLADLDFLVVQDIVDTEALQYADVILPATTFAEMDGTLTNMEGRVQRLRPAIKPVGLSRPGWVITRDIARAMGCTSWDYETAADVMAEISALVPAYAGVSYETLGADGILRRFEPAAEVQAGPFSLDEVRRLTDDAFPLTLITERNLFYYHGACLTEEVSGMNLIKQEEVLYLNAADASRLGVVEGALVKVVSPYGSTECIVAGANGMMPEGAVFASFNRANGSTLFPALTPTAKAYPVRIESGS